LSEFHSKKLSRALNFSFPFHLSTLILRHRKLKYHFNFILFRYFIAQESSTKEDSVKIKIPGLHTIQS
jgi:hypothetical protein